MSERTIMSPEDMQRAVIRIAHEILERNRGTKDIILVGVQTRGVPLAERLATAIQGIEGITVAVGSLDISLYRDDLSSLALKPIIHRADVPVDVTNKQAVLVDDVLYTGRSTRAAMDALIDMGRPESIQLAVLVDRGHRELPIRADYVGKNVPTSRNEEIKVYVEEVDGKDKVTLLSPNKVRNQ